MKKYVLFMIVFAVVMTGCRAPGARAGQEKEDSLVTSQGGSDVLISDVERAVPEDVSDEQLGELVKGNTAFALDMYQDLAGKSTDNVFFSPISISLALALTYAGAGGDTAAQMADVLGFSMPQDELHPAFNTLERWLSRVSKDREGGDTFKLNIANALWGQEGHSFQEPFLDTLAENYGAGMHSVDFRADPAAAGKIINQWAADQTEDKIQNLIPDGMLTSDARLVLTNAIYFFARWAEQFKEARTEKEDFHLLDGNTEQVDMMHQRNDFAYTTGDGYKALSMNYEGRDFSMVVVLPDQGRFEEIEKALDAGMLSGDMHYGEVDLKLPRFKIEADYSLGEILAGMGMTDAFSEGIADFTAMDGVTDETRLYIGFVLHKAYIDVDENGTEAAAATAVAMMAGAAPGPPPQPLMFHADRPFLFVIRHNDTNTILFMGRVMNPLK